MTGRSATLPRTSWAGANDIIARLEAAADGRAEPPTPWPAGLEGDDATNNWIRARDQARPLRDVLEETDGSYERLGRAPAALPVDYDAWLSFAAPAFEFHATDTAHGGIIANYTTDTGPVRVQLDADGRGGIARFDVGMRADPEAAPPPGAPERYGGVMRWRCGDAPAAG